MNLRCIYCQTPFTLGRAEMLNAIVTMNEKHQNHYDAHCPRCRRANSISRQRMELFFPNWQAAAKELASAPQETPATSAPKAEIPSTAYLKTEPISKAMKDAVNKAAAEKKVADKKPAEKTVVKEKKPAAARTPGTPAAKKSATTSKATTSTAKAKKPAAKTAESKAKKK
jgi:hypothetical protein